MTSAAAMPSGRWLYGPLPDLLIGCGLWYALALLALVVHAIVWWAITASLPHASGAAGALMLVLQPVLATLWGVLLFSETLQPLQIAGATITLAAIHHGSTRA